MTANDAIALAGIYRLTAVNFWESAKIISNSLETKDDGSPVKLTAIPFYFLISHSVELFLKAALLKRGFQEKDLKKFDSRHNLSKLLSALERKGVLVSTESIKLIFRLNSQHHNHALRYDLPVNPYMPPPNAIFSMLEELLVLTRISTQGI